MLLPTQQYNQATPKSTTACSSTETRGGVGEGDGSLSVGILAGNVGDNVRDNGGSVGDNGGSVGEQRGTTASEGNVARNGLRGVRSRVISALVIRIRVVVRGLVRDVLDIGIVRRVIRVGRVLAGRGRWEWCSAGGS